MTLVLSSEPATFDKWRLPRDGDLADRAVRIENPISVEQTICRVSLLPGLLETLSINKQYDLPQSIFEVGDCSFLDPAAETGAGEERLAAAAMIGTHVGYADVRAVCDAFAHAMDAKITVRPVEHPSFIPGRAAALFKMAAVDDDHAADAAGKLGKLGERIGVMGELHPEVIEAYGLKHAIAVLELLVAIL